MLDSVFKNRITTFLIEIGVFAGLATGFILASKHFNYQPDTILLLGYILGITTEKLHMWFYNKHEGLNS